MMKYWLFQQNQVLGPYDREEMSQIKGFSAESLVCPEGRKGTEMGDWQRAGIVSELSEALLKNVGGVATATRGVGEGVLPTEPTLRDLAVLGSLQEKTTFLENSVSQLQENLCTRDTELARFKVELASKERAAHDLELKVADLESQVIPLSATREERMKGDEKVQELAAAQDEIRKELTQLREAVAQPKSGDNDKALEELAAKFAERERQIDELTVKLLDQENRLQAMASARVAAGSPAEDMPKPVSMEPGPSLSMETLTPESLPTALGAPAMTPPAEIQPLSPASGFQSMNPPADFQPMGSPSNFQQITPPADIQPMSPPSGLQSMSSLPAFQPMSGAPAFEPLPAAPASFMPLDSAESTQLPPLSTMAPISLTPLGGDIGAGPAGASTPMPAPGLQAAPLGSTPFPSPTPSAMDSIDSPPLAFVALNEPAMDDKPAPTPVPAFNPKPSADFTPTPGFQMESPIPEARQPGPSMGKLAGIPGIVEPEEMVAGKSLKRKSRSGAKVVMVAVSAGLIGVGGVGCYLRLAKPKRAAFGAPALKTQDEASPLASKQEPKTAEAPPPAAPSEPTDPLLAAVELAKTYPIPGGATLQQKLEGVYPPQGGLSPWMVEKREGVDKYQVNYYTNQNSLVYEFLVRPQAKILQGINAPAQAVLNGETPASAKKGKASKAPPAKEESSEEIADKPAPAKPARSARPKAKSAAKKAAKPKADDAPSDASDQANIDELLLPGMGQGAPSGQ